ncbi:hypothetical protein LTR93_011836 [Exophiala xenobiotica]|nr:hypothetical protein LTR93_011836 [Exophiala xenobiotica]
MFYNSWSRLPAGMVPDYSPWNDTVSEFFDYRQFLQKSIRLLAAFSLITRSTDASLSLHLLVHEWCRDRLAPGEQQLNYRRALWLLTDSVRWEFDTDDYIFRRSLVSHVHELLQRRDRLDDMSEEDKMQRWPKLALILAENGWMEDALPLMETVVELQKSKFGTDHAATLWSTELTEQVVERRKSKLGAEDPDTLLSMHSLAVCYGQAGRRVEALHLMEEVVKLQKTKLGLDHLDMLTSMHYLANSFMGVGRQAEALSLTEEVVTIHKSKLGTDHL